MEPVKELRLRPVGDHDARQPDRARPHALRGMKADGAGDNDECGGPCESQSQSPENDFHAKPLTLKLAALPQNALSQLRH